MSYHPSICTSFILVTSKYDNLVIRSHSVLKSEIFTKYCLKKLKSKLEKTLGKSWITVPIQKDVFVYIFQIVCDPNLSWSWSVCFQTDANTNDDDEEKDKDDTTSTSHKNNLISFTASSYPHFEPRKFTYDDLRQLFRSVGCVSDEIRVECTHGKYK